jgi:glutaredoxin
MYSTEERCPYCADETAYLNSQQYIYHHFALRQSQCFRVNHKNEGLSNYVFINGRERFACTSRMNEPEDTDRYYNIRHVRGCKSLRDHLGNT